MKQSSRPVGNFSGTTSVPALQDATHVKRRWNAVDLSLIAVFAALMAASVAVPGVNVGVLGVPITLQTLVVSLCGLVLGFGRGTAAVGLYILLGLAGLPIFSGFRAGPAVLASPSAGYIIGFIFAAAIVGALASIAIRSRFRRVGLLLASLAGMVVIHIAGITGFVIYGMGLPAAIAADVIYLPGDVLKNIVAVAIALSLHRASRPSATPTPVTLSPSISFESASVVFEADSSTGARQKTILRPLSLELKEQRIGIIGANGSGKSTLLRLLNGLVLPTAGRVLINGLDPRSHGTAVRRDVGFVFTDPLSQLVMPTPLEDIELSLRRLKLGRVERREKALGVLRDFGLEHLAQNSIFDLSGGERQLLALATVLAVEPKILVLDEPSTLLDLRNTRMLGRLLATLPQQTIMATHDLELAAECERVLLVEDATIVFDGPAAQAIARYREAAG